MSLIDRIKGNIHETATMAREGMEDLQTKRELGEAYGELGRRAFALVESGKLTAAELDFDVERIRKLKAELEVEELAATAPSKS